MTAQPIKMYSAEAYLELERAADYKSEYYGGEIFAMASVGLNHNRIKENLSGEIGFFLKGKSCQGFSSDMRVHIPENAFYTYPDLLILCGKPEFLDRKTDTILNPSVIIEVLSPSIGEYDRGQKFHLYRSISSLVEYVLIDSRKLMAEVYRKADNGLWVLASEAYAIDGAIEIGHSACIWKCVTSMRKTKRLFSRQLFDFHHQIFPILCCFFELLLDIGIEAVHLRQCHRIIINLRVAQLRFRLCLAYFQIVNG